MAMWSSSQATEEENGGFLSQPAWDDYLSRASDSPYDPERSGWERVEALEVAESLESDALCGEPEDAFKAWAEDRRLIGSAQSPELDIEMRTRVLRDGRVEGLLQRWGFKDDSIAGVDHRVSFVSDNGCWEVEKVRARHYCRRGIEEGLICR